MAPNCVGMEPVILLAKSQRLPVSVVRWPTCDGRLPTTFFEFLCVCE